MEFLPSFIRFPMQEFEEDKGITRNHTGCKAKNVLSWENSKEMYK